MKTRIGLAMAVLTFSVFAGNVCTWTGAGGDGKFSTPGNWSVMPVSGNGDLLFFPVGEKATVGELVVENDLEGLSVAAIRTDGHNNSVFTLNGNALTLTGAAQAVQPEIPAATVISNYTALVLNVPLNVTRGGRDAQMRFFGQQLTVNGKITVTDVQGLFLYGRLSVAYADYIGEEERYPSASLGSTFNAPIEAPNTVIWENIGNNCGGQNVTFNAKVTAKALATAAETRDSSPHFAVSGNDIPDVNFVGHYLYLDADDVFGPNTVLHDTKAGQGWMWTGDIYLKNGTHQTINRIDGNGDYLSNANFANSYNLRGTAELEMRGSADASTCMRVQDEVTLIWNPTGNYRQTFRDRANTTKGEIIVRGGTFAVAGTAVFSNVPILTVGAGAKLEIASTSTEPAVFGALRSLLLGDGAECAVATGCNPFAANTTMAVLGSGAKFKVASGMDVKLTFLSVNGVRIANGVYTADAGNPWLEGEGSVTVTGGGTTGVTYWLKSGDGDWDAASNWSEGVPGATSSAVVIGNGPSTIQLSGASVLPAKLSVRNMSGTTTVLLPAGERSWNPTELALDAGGRIEVPTGAKLVSDDATGTVRINGGGLYITGGEVVYTNFQGSFSVQGLTSATGQVFLANGVFQFSHKSQTDAYRLLLRSGGELYATNGLVVTPVINYPFNQVGGRIVIAGNAELRNGRTSNVEWRFGAGESIFEDDAVMRNLKSASRFHVTSYDANIPARLVFRGNAYFTGENLEDPSIGSTGGARSIMEVDSGKPNGVQLGYRCNVGCDSSNGEFIMKRGYVLVGYRGLNVGGSTGNQWNMSSTAQGAHGVLRMQGGALKLTDNGTTSEGAFVGFRLGDGGPAHLARDLKGAYTGIAEVSGGVITNNSSSVIGGGRGIGTYTQTGGTFLHRSTAAAFIVGCAGGTGTLTLGGGEMNISGPVFVGGALTNQIEGGYVLDKFYNGNYPVDRHDALGTLTVTGGTFRCARDLLLGCDGAGTLAAAGASHDFTVAGNLVLSNTTVAAAGEVPGWTTTTKLNFKFDPVAGIAPLKVTGKVVNAAGTSVLIDLGAYNGKKTKFPLITASAFEGSAFDQVEIVGDEAQSAKLMQNATSIDLVLQHGMTLIFR